MSKEGELVGKVAVITGGASGIGRATARLLGRKGAAVAIVDENADEGSLTTQQIIGDGGQAIFIRADVSQATDCQHAIQQTLATFGQINILINNAGIMRRSTVLDLDEADWDRVMAVNAKSVFLMSRYTIPQMVKAGGGVIVNTASGWGLVGGRQAASYCASKGAVVLLTKAMALDHGPQNIRVNAVAPGDTDTPMLHSEASQLNLPEKLFLAQAADRPLGRYGQPEDIARAILYLASDESAYVTGTVLVVDGGGLAG
jgi:NAD(P)-dependent dehydrogenase (short-subunit alcohol dehydrogenase family)